MLRQPMDMQCLHVHLSIVYENMEACENIQKAEGVDRYASMSFKNATGGIKSYVETVLQVQIHIREKYFYNTINGCIMQQSM